MTVNDMGIVNWHHVHPKLPLSKKFQMTGKRWESESPFNALWALSDLADNDGPPPYWDDLCANRPEDARLAISNWSKGRILFYVEATGNHEAARILERMDLIDARAIALRRDTVFIKGQWGPGGNRRHTMMYRLDMDSINNLEHGQEVRA